MIPSSALTSFTLCVTILWLAAITNEAAASLPIELEVVTEAGVPITAPQQWAERLGKLGLRRVQLRAARGDDTAKIDTDNWQTAKQIKVVAILNARNELILPGKKFGVGDMSRLKSFLESLPQLAEEGDEQRGRFGLTETQFREVFEEFSRPLGVVTADKTTAQLLDHLERRFQLPVEREANARTALSKSQSLPAELQQLSTGAALAYALRQEGLTVHPEKPAGLPIRLVVAPYERNRDVWPVGWKPEASPRQVAPHLFESLSFEIDGFTLAAAMEALAPRIRMPVLVDQWVLAERNIRLDEVDVTLPRRKTFLKASLDRMLSQGRLACEIRVDETGTAFLWVTQFGSDSRPAEN